MTTRSGETLNHYEPSASVDGRLVIWHGRVNNRAPSSVINAAYNPDPMRADGWSEVMSIVDLYYNLGPGSDDEVMVDGIPFSKKYPIAAKPMRDPNGNILPKGTYLPGAYPWLSFDASEAFFPSVRAFDGPLRSAVVAIGQRTNYGMMHLDGLVNPSRSEVMTRDETKEPVRFQDMRPEGILLHRQYQHHSLGDTDEPTARGAHHRIFLVPVTLTKSMWSPVNRKSTAASGSLARNLTSMQHGGVYGSFLSHTMRYVEMDLSAAEDGHYLLFSPMNENLTFNQEALARSQDLNDREISHWQLSRDAVAHDPNSSVDLSGYYNTISLDVAL